MHWKQIYNTSCSTKKPKYNSSRRRIYKWIELNPEHLKTVIHFYDESVKVDTIQQNETQYHINKLLKSILVDRGNRKRFDAYADKEGSAAVGLKVGNADESDQSVEILVNTQLIHWSDEPFKWEYKDDDIDSYVIEAPTTFVEAGKRYFPYEDRQLIKTREPPEIQNGFIAVCIGKKDYSKFRKCCISARGRKWLLPYPLLWEFHNFVDNAVYGYDGVTLNKAARGPAITLTITQNGGPNISVDITLKLTLPSETLSVTDFWWPRCDTRKWLTEEKIDQVACQPIYLVPKGDKYWKISFANCEYEILEDIDGNGTWRKACLRIMKKKLMQWRSKSTTGLKGLSSYLLKTTLLWLCEILPRGRYWFKDQLANRYLNFVQEFAYRLRKGYIGEYFNPSVNLLEGKDDDCIDELIEFLEEEITSLGGSHR